MSVAKAQVLSALTPSLPHELVDRLLDEYLEIKQHFAFRRFRPNELNGGRFAETVLRIVQHLDNPPYTPIGTSLGNTNAIIQHAAGNPHLPEAVQIFIPRLARILLDVRNRRDVAHLGGDVSPNLSDSVLVSHIADWVVTELIRIYHSCTIETARKIAQSINEFRVPIVAEVDGFVRVQNTELRAKQKTLVVLYYKSPARVSVSALMNWVGYSNSTEYRRDVIGRLHSEALIHHADGHCTLLPKGILWVEKYIPMELLV